MSTTNSIRLHGNEAIEFAQENGLMLSKYSDAISGPAAGLSLGRAREIAREDSGLVYIDVATEFEIQYSAADGCDTAPEYFPTRLHGKRFATREAASAAIRAEVGDHGSYDGEAGVAYYESANEGCGDFSIVAVTA